jgi:hypothetical protein
MLKEKPATIGGIGLERFQHRLLAGAKEKWGITALHRVDLIDPRAVSEQLAIPIAARN